MSHPAKALPSAAASQESGHVVLREGETVVVRTGHHGDLKARRAASCLLQPQVGDYVLIAHLADGGAYVLAVLEREDPSRHRMVLDGSLEIALPQGKFSVASKEGTEFLAGKEFAVTTTALKVDAQEGTLWVRALSFLGENFQAELSRVKTVAKTVDGVFERLSQHAKRVYRTAEEFEHVRAGQIDLNAQELFSVRSENTVMTAEKLVKLDGSQIHLG